ncbi:response regulator containing a CheY-like receiver domain and an HTH DNA-binding domain [Terriglobus roseus DSM 18391]|uniref:Response regulator containing a CheY-like receiver domain and an HTH DNA-binding domain n=1 Tax=Terriglobus roseus (strain DSM 18391 / NRRL B-41598 / KBS 63) TaxID=926566 RepID=I3ZJ77_TERRK|nr:response regulator transcription factor [Terriglobus roseus]AFL89295.1 response regulator containing a CheY-like receiver domain and an HTH DNA-binding domain [Terriglobus roseus DSM 18391]
MVRIVLADDHTVLRAGLKSLLERQRDFEVVGEAGDGRELLRVVDEQRPDVVISDISMPKLNGVEATSQIVAKHPKTHVIVLSMHTDEAYVLRALKAGARGYLVKESAEADLMMAIRTVHAGKAFFSPSVSALLVEDYVRQMRDRGVEDSYELLSSREREVLQLVAEGQSNKDIAQQLGLSVYTIETHRGNLLQKLNLHSVPELILYAVRKGVIC